MDNKYEPVGVSHTNTDETPTPGEEFGISRSYTDYEKSKDRVHSETWQTEYSLVQDGQNTSPTHKFSWKRLTKISWFFEILAWVMSLLFFLAIIGVLRAYNGKTDPELPINITVNTIVEFLASWGKFFLEIALVAAFGQTKWLWMRKKRRLGDLQYLDKASHDKWDSFKMLVFGKGE